MDAFPRTWISTHSTVKVSSSSCFLSTFLTTIVQTRECANGPGVTRGVKTWPSSASTSQVSVRIRSGLELSRLSGAHLGRQEHGAGAGPDANRLPAGAAAAEGEGEAAGHDEPPAPEQEAGGGEGEDEVGAAGRPREWVSKDSRARDQQAPCRPSKTPRFWAACNARPLIPSQPWRSG